MAGPGRGKKAEEPGLTANGASRIDEKQSQFGELLSTLATSSARRRGAKDIDNTDVEGAYQSLLSPRQRPLVVDILAEIGLAIGGWASGYATSVLLGAGSGSNGLVILFIGALIVVGCAVLKHVAFR